MAQRAKTKLPPKTMKFEVWVDDKPADGEDYLATADIADRLKNVDLGVAGVSVGRALFQNNVTRNGDATPEPER